MSWYRDFRSTLGTNPCSWSKFKEGLLARYRDRDFQVKLFTQMYELTPKKSQQEYTDEFQSLLNRSQVQLPEVVKRWFYQQNLPPALTVKISEQLPQTLAETIEYAHVFTSSTTPLVQNRPMGANNGNKKKGGKGKAAGSSAEGKVTTRDVATVTCFRCGAKGHYANKCTQPPPQKN